jgi:uncharacterized coiled-coil protein SlyX
MRSSFSKMLEPPSILSIIAMIGTLLAWTEARSTSFVQFEDRLGVLEKQVADHNTALSQLNSVGARLDGLFQLITAMKDNTEHQNDALNRRLDALEQRIGERR